MNSVEIKMQFYENVPYYLILFWLMFFTSGTFSVNTVLNSYRNGSTDNLDYHKVAVDPFLSDCIDAKGTTCREH